MRGINILNKEGMLTKEDRKEKLIHSCRYVTFHTNLELSEPIKVVPLGTSKEITLDNYSNDLASFICWWTHFVKKDLNGFMMNATFDMGDLKIVQ